MCLRHARVFAPLGLTDTSYRPAASLRARAAPTEKRQGAWIAGTVHDPARSRWAAWRATPDFSRPADDLAVFAQMLLDGGQYGGKRILQAKTVT